MKDVRHIAWLTTLALAARLWWVWSRAWVAGDTSDYLTIARNLAFHHVFSLSDNPSGPLLPTTHRPPLYPALIALLWWGDSPPVVAVMLLQSLLGAATVSLVYLMARDRFNRHVAVLASLGMALAPMTGFFTAVLLTETLFTFLLTLAVFWWGREKAVLAGLALGLAALTRPGVLFFILALPLLSLLPSMRHRLRTFLIIAVAAVAVLSPWVVRNAVVFGRFIPVAASGWGMNLLCGTIETELVGIKVWTGSEWALLDISNHPLLQVPPGLSETEKDSVLLSRAVARIVESPGQWLVVRAGQYPKLFLDSGNYLLGSHNIPISQALAELRFGVLLVKGLFLLGNLFVIVVAALGFFTERKRMASLIHLVSFPVFLLLAQLPMWTESRYSLPIMPMAAIFFAVGWRRLRNKTSH
ncbi:MAG TPA: glycosyltransferase family 39 protein [Pyrinomonadaceae bacterium]|nr:glycosyltransferase family 39 protein [Pyrinomonadaceae bacterium]